MHNIYAIAPDGTLNTKIVVGTIGTEGHTSFRNVVNGFIAGIIPVKIKTNLSQMQWDKFCNGELSELELRRAI